MIWGLLLAVFALIADQASKYFVAEEVLANKMGIMYTSFFNLVRAWNSGVSFSLLDNLGDKGAVILSVFAAVIVIMLFVWMYKEPNKYIKAAIGLIIGGAIGNIIDRVRFGAVFDFLDFHFEDTHWPAFNLADAFICIGAFVIVIISLFGCYKREKK